MKSWIYRALMMVVFTFLGNHVARCNQHRPIAYDKTHVDKLHDLKKYKVSLVEVAKMEEPAIQLYNPKGWESDAGDFRKVEIKFKDRKSFTLENVDSWMEILKSREGQAKAIIDFLKLPDKADKVTVHPYFIKLDMGKGACILILFGWSYDSMPGLVTLLYVEKDKAEVVFNKQVDLEEIEQTPKGGYCLRGTRPEGGEYATKPWEIGIEDQKLSFRYLPFKKIYTHQNPPVAMYDCIGLAYALEQLGIDGFKDEQGKVIPANAMIDRMRNSVDWQEIMIPHRAELPAMLSQVQALVNEGNVIVAAWYNPIGRHGHVALVVPGELQKSNNWDCLVPTTMDTGGRNRYSSGKLTLGFSTDRKEDIIFFRYIGEIKS